MDPSSENDRRGRYDRSLTSRERARLQRERLYRAAVEVLGAVGVVGMRVDDVLAHAHTGRNTFYAQFAGIPEFLAGLHAWVADEIARRLEGSIAAAATPIEQLRALSETWLAIGATEPLVARTLFLTLVPEPRHPPAIGSLVEVIGPVIGRAHRLGIVSQRAEPRRLAALAGSYLLTASSLPRAPAPRVEPAATELVDLTLRAFR